MMKKLLYICLTVVVTLVLARLAYEYLFLRKLPPIEDFNQLVIECREMLLSRDLEERYESLNRDDFPPTIRSLDPHRVTFRGDYVLILVARRDFIITGYMVFIDEEGIRKKHKENLNHKTDLIATDHPLVYKYFVRI